MYCWSTASAHGTCDDIDELMAAASYHARQGSRFIAHDARGDVVVQVDVNPRLVKLQRDDHECQ